MILKDKMFIIAGNLDDSIKRQTSIYDIKLFKSFLDFENYVNSVYVTVDTLILTSNEFPFTASNMSRIKSILDTDFLTVTGNIIYLVDNTYSTDYINKFLQEKNYSKWAVYQGDLSVRFITSIVTGDARQSEEVLTEVVTYRVRASEYYKHIEMEQQHEDDDVKYYVDEDLFQGIPMETEPEDTKPTSDDTLIVNYIVGDTVERTVMAFLVAQYRALSGKTLILEKDWEYHRLTDMVLSSEIPCCLLYVEDLLEDAMKVIRVIKTTQQNLIVIGTKNRKKYSYNFLLDILESSLRGFIYYIVRECDYAETPYGRFYTIVMSNTMPEILRCCNKLKYKPDKNKATFVGMQLNQLGPVNLSSQEMESVLSVLLEENGLAVQRVYVDGILLKGVTVVYDILGILNRGNKR